MILTYIKNTILDFLFPKTCLGCKEEGTLVCIKCLSHISFINFQKCPSCKKTNNIGNFCSKKCKNHFYFDQLIVSTNYEKNGIIQKMIINFKYKFSEELVKPLGEILKTQYVSLSQDLRWMHEAIFVPVPIHKNRFKFRGFNQSFILAQYLQKSLKHDPLLKYFFHKITVCDCLYRYKYFPEQAKLSKKDRLKNLTNGFSVKNEFIKDIKDKFIILIDDVATTCSTLNECSKALKQANVRYICGFVLARG